MSDTAAILGPGAVGGAIAARLSAAGVPTVCVAHPDAVGPIALGGLAVETRTGHLTARVEATERLERPVRLLLVTVKAGVLEDAIERVEPDAVAEGVVVPLLNGLEHMDVLRARFDGRVAAGSVSHYQAYRVSRVQIVEASPPPLVTVASETIPRHELEGALELLRQAGLDVRVEDDERRVLWHKLARIAPLAAATSASGLTVGELRDQPVWRDRLELAVEEACAVAAADGVALQPEDQWAIIDAMANETTTSAARDVAAGRASELDAILGAVLRAAERHRLVVPTLEELAAEAGLR